MFRLGPILTVCAMICLSGAVAAQEQATDSETGSTEQTPAETTTDLLDLGEPVQQGPQIGDRYAKAEFGDWSLACVKTASGDDPCSLMQVLLDETSNPVAEVSMFRIEGGGQAVAGATVIVPLETLLTAQLQISVDGAQGKRYAYSFCNPIGCVAQIGLTQEDVDAFKRGREAQVTIVPANAPTQQVVVSMSLTGFTAGYDAVDVVSN